MLLSLYNFVNQTNGKIIAFERSSHFALPDPFNGGAGMARVSMM